MLHNLGTQVPVSVEPKTINISFTWPDSVTTEVEYINEALSEVLLSDIEIVDDKDYVTTTTTYDANENIVDVQYRLGFESMDLVGTQDPSAVQHHFQVETAAYPADENWTNDKFISMWEEENPDKKWYSVTGYTYKDNNAFLIFFYDKEDQ